MKDSIGKLLKPRDYRIMEWKNKRGQSTEIAIFPEDAAFQEGTFFWRLSSACVTEGGPFSNFPEYDRFLTVIKGESMTLCLEGDQKEWLIKKSQVHRFSGDEPISYRLDSGEITDLNLIFRRDRVKAEFEVVQISAKPRSFEVGGKAAFVFGASGAMSATLYPGEVKFTIREGETLQMQTQTEEKRFILLEPKNSDSSGASSVVLIEIDF